MARTRVYEVVVAGTAGRTVADSLAPLTVTARNGETTISGESLDAAMLQAVLRTVERLALELVAVRSSVNGHRA
jgi:hypothetical protein